MPRTKRPRRRAHQIAKGGHPLVKLDALSPLVGEDPLIANEQRQIEEVLGYADGGPRPDGYLAFEVDPRFGDMWFRRAAVSAIAVQMRVMARALLPEATAVDFREANVAARAVQDRLFGKPIEKLAVAGRVKIEFGGLNPDAFPQEPKEQTTEVVEIPGDLGTEVDEED